VVRQHVVDRLRAVGVALRMGVARAGRRQRLKTESLKITCAAHVPRIGNDEAAGLVQLAEGPALVGSGRTGGRHGKLPAWRSANIATALCGGTAHFGDW